MFIKNPHNPCSRFTEKGILAKLKRTPGTLKYINDPSQLPLPKGRGFHGVINK